MKLVHRNKPTKKGAKYIPYTSKVKEALEHVDNQFCAGGKGTVVVQKYCRCVVLVVVVVCDSSCSRCSSCVWGSGSSIRSGNISSSSGSISIS